MKELNPPIIEDDKRQYISNGNKFDHSLDSNIKISIENVGKNDKKEVFEKESKGSKETLPVIPNTTTNQINDFLKDSLEVFHIPELELEPSAIVSVPKMEEQNIPNNALPKSIIVNEINDYSIQKNHGCVEKEQQQKSLVNINEKAKIDKIDNNETKQLFDKFLLFQEFLSHTEKIAAENKLNLKINSSSSYPLTNDNGKEQVASYRKFNKNCKIKPQSKKTKNSHSSISMSMDYNNTNNNSEKEKEKDKDKDKDKKGNDSIKPSYSTFNNSRINNEENLLKDKLKRKIHSSGISHETSKKSYNLSRISNDEKKSINYSVSNNIYKNEQIKSKEKVIANENASKDNTIVQKKCMLISSPPVVNKKSKEKVKEKVKDSNILNIDVESKDQKQNEKANKKENIEKSSNLKMQKSNSTKVISYNQHINKNVNNISDINKNQMNVSSSGFSKEKEKKDTKKYTHLFKNNNYLSNSLQTILNNNLNSKTHSDKVASKLFIMFYVIFRKCIHC